MSEAADYIAKLRSSADNYAQALATEGKVWGGEFSNADRIEARRRDQEAAMTLGIAASRLRLHHLLQQRGLTFEEVLSLACGSGRAERQLLESHVAAKAFGIDISLSALEEARRVAADQDMAATYEQGDLNTIVLPPARFDLVVTQTCLHHVLELEHLAEQIWLTLKPGGFLWIDDFIGETQFQWLDKRLDIANAMLAALPARFKMSKLHGREIGPAGRRPPGNLISPFEAIRSGEIMPVFLRWFEIEEAREGGAIGMLVTPQGTRANYVGSDDDKALFALIRTFERVLLENEVLPPTEGQYLLRRRPAPLPAPQ